MTERDHIRLWIGGAWVEAVDGATFDAVSPSTGVVIASVAQATREDADGRSLRRGRRSRAGPG
jgi:acyl-CoA reductase-like NAD-dependent aldehyde dehydrogenase